MHFLGFKYTKNNNYQLHPGGENKLPTENCLLNALLLHIILGAHHISLDKFSKRCVPAKGGHSKETESFR